MAQATFILGSERDRDYAIRYIQRAKLDGRQEVVIRRVTRHKGQNALLHSTLTDIAEQLVWPAPPANDGSLHDITWWKRRATLGWMIEEKQEQEVITSLFGDSNFGLFVPHTSDLDVDQFASLCEWVMAFAAENGVVLKQPDRRPEPPPWEAAI